MFRKIERSAVSHLNHLNATEKRCEMILKRFSPVVPGVAAWSLPVVMLDFVLLQCGVQCAVVLDEDVAGAVVDNDELVILEGWH